MNKSGEAYVLLWEKEKSYSYLGNIPEAQLPPQQTITDSKWSTLFISGGRQNKISKGDIVGLFIQKGNLGKDDIGQIELKQDCAFVAVSSNKIDSLLPLVNNKYLKKKKVRITEI